MKSKNKFIGLAALGLTLVFIVSGCTIKLGGGSATAEKVDGGIWKSIDSAETWTQKVDVPLTGGKLASIANIDVAKIALESSGSQHYLFGHRNRGHYLQL